MQKSFLALVITCSFHLTGNAQKLPRVIILATGGTIAGKGSSPDRAAYEPGKILIQDLLTAIPGINKLVDVQGEQIANVRSANITIKIWIKLANRINEIFTNNETDRVVITHGTDTQEEAAYFLSLTSVQISRLYLPDLCGLQQPSVRTGLEICTMPFWLLLPRKAKAGVLSKALMK